MKRRAKGTRFFRAFNYINMKKITDIKQQVKNPTRVNIYLDNTFYCGLELETVMKNRLKKGMEIDEERLDEIQRESESARALDKALSFISRSKKTKKQVETYLAGKGYTEKTIESVVEKMKGYNFIDDGEYAEEYAAAYSKNKGKRLIASELKRKGVSDADMRAALENVVGESEAAENVARKYMKNKEKNRENTLKCYKYLLGKGFDYDTAKIIAEREGKNEDDSF